MLLKLLEKMMMMSRVFIPICNVKSLCLISATYSMLKRQFLHDFHHCHTYILNSHDNNINISHNNYYYNRHRLYHSSTISLGPKNKKSNNNDNNTGSTITLPDVKDIKLKMEIYIDKYSKELSTLKIGIVSIDIFNNINVSSYGTVSNLGQVTIKSATNININVFDPSTTKLICDAIKDAGLGLNPTIEGSNITVFIPKPSKDSRELMKKSASKMAEKVYSCY
jgi:hypothetical protein